MDLPAATRRACAIHVAGLRGHRASVERVTSRRGRRSRDPSHRVLLGHRPGRGARLAARRGHRVFATARNRDDLAELERGRPDALRPRRDRRRLDRARRSKPCSAARRPPRRPRQQRRLRRSTGPSKKSRSTEWRAQFDVNLFGTIAVTQAVLPAMRKAGERHDRQRLLGGRQGRRSRSRLRTAPPSTRSKPCPTRCASRSRPSASASSSSSRARSRRASASARARESRRCSRGPARTGSSTRWPRGRWTATSSGASFRPRRWRSVIVDAIEAARPRARYPVGIMARALIPLRRALPDRWLDALMRRTLRMPSPP